MKFAKWLGVIAVIYVAFVVLFETVYLGMYQPSFESSGIPMLVITTTDASGEAQSRRLASFRTDYGLYVSAHHWPRGWYKRAIQYPNVRVEIDGIESDYLAVAVVGQEFEKVSADYPLPLFVRFLMGFPPERNILRLDPFEKTSTADQEAI